MKRAAIFLFCVLALLLAACGGTDDNYETDSIKDYGIIPDLYQNRNLAMADAFEQFFPQELESSFVNVRYHYKAVGMRLEATAEMYLEFSVEDKDEFTALVDKLVPDTMTNFKYYRGYKEYVFSDVYCRDNGKLKYADIRKILVQPYEQSFVFISLIAHDAYRPTDTLTEYFDRFGIEPDEYGFDTESWETYALKNYGEIGGGEKYSFPAMQTAFDTFFPQELSSTLHNVRYHYKVRDRFENTKKGTTAAEMYLEFTAAEDEFCRFVNEVAPIGDFSKVVDRDGWLEYVISDSYEYEDFVIMNADIQKVLIKPDEQRMVFAAMIVETPDEYSTCEFTYYSMRFDN